MAIADAMRQGWRRMPDRIAVTLLAQTQPGVYTQTSVSNCWRRGRGVREMENSGGVYSFQASDWWMPKAFQTTQPLPGWIIRLTAPTNTVSPYYGLGGDYIIMPDGVKEAGALGAWQCSTGYPFLQGGLTDTISIYEPIMLPGSGARNEETGRVNIAIGLSCKIQNDPPNAAEIALGKFQIPNSAKCFLSSQVDVQPHYRIVDQNGQTYSIDSTDKTDMLGTLQSLSLMVLL